MPVAELLPMILGPGGAVVVLATLAYGFYSGRIVRGSEHQKVVDKLDAEIARRIKEAEQGKLDAEVRLRTAQALDKQDRQQVVDSIMESVRGAPHGGGHQ